MPTNDERREVARRLRDFEQLREVFNESNICAFADALGVGYMDWEHICAHLADLIEPEERTCRNVHENAENDGNNGIAYFECSECGCAVNGDESVAIYGEAPISQSNGYASGWVTVGFCPNCGAKVVEE